MDLNKVVAATLVVDVQISPDGAQVAYMTVPASRDGEHATSQIWLVPATGGPARRIVRSAGLDAFPRWSPDGRRLAFISDRRQRGIPQLYVLDLTGGEAQRLTDLESGVGGLAWSPDGERIAFLAAPAREEAGAEGEAADDPLVVDARRPYQSLWVVDVPADPRSTRERPAARQIGPQDTHVGSIQGTNAYGWAPDGQSLVAHLSPLDELPDPALGWLGTITLDGEVSYWRRADTVLGPLRYSPDGQRILFNAADGTTASPYALQTIPAAGGEARLCAPGFEGSFLAYDWLPDGRVIAGANIRQRAEFVIVDPESGSVEPAFEPIDRPATGPYLLSLSADRRRAAFIRITNHSYGDVYVAEVGQEPRRLTDLNPWLRDFRLGEAREVAWTSGGSVEIQGMLILPVGYQPGTRYPTLVQIHGGPSETWGHAPHASWSQWGQMMAQRGYAVLIPNYRGSSGRGSEFLRLIVGRGGELEYEDLMSGVDWLIEEGISDPEQLVIGGWSYGGFMTAWTVTQTQRFKAAVVGAGITNRISHRGTSDLPSIDDDYFGNFGADTATRWRHSPMRCVGDARTPTLILHGERDARIRVSQAYEFYEGLKSNSTETQMVVYPREGHFISERAHQLELMERVAGWFDRHLGRAPADSTPDKREKTLVAGETRR